MDLTCKYTYKPCMNPRTTKRNGEPHTLCEYHRTKANSIQRAYATKKRQMQGKAKEAAAVAALSPVASPPLSEELGVEEFDFLHALLRDDSALVDFGDLAMTHEEFVMLDELF
ncbi:hypothetical protein SPRG_13592 [Saprolegnia parasitica CBS 223.65]|uniref:Uncharacterized protein n=1 Tax=Saprolegnia parasitica (strain CBS 223.65) TaxID=695850 RepID=A0A067BSR8_SAPPC|nr:hypothetical protein SPRG_13592 [Saprolegnia parasitica CBS 223.65]KDO21293.1 hypothetical protein SPRG_13592 [Saprolegnia parasitica CBS 223.65]|eukprot:XP_012208035.1 hypothetical protein SPRG_13592 [Saprolegnia parasitica CBS 223.65]